MYGGSSGSDATTKASTSAGAGAGAAAASSSSSSAHAEREGAASPTKRARYRHPAEIDSVDASITRELSSPKWRSHDAHDPLQRSAGAVQATAAACQQHMCGTAGTAQAIDWRVEEGLFYNAACYWSWCVGDYRYYTPPCVACRWQSHNTSGCGHALTGSTGERQAHRAITLLTGHCVPWHPVLGDCYNKLGTSCIRGRRHLDCVTCADAVTLPSHTRPVPACVEPA